MKKTLITLSALLLTSLVPVGNITAQDSVLNSDVVVSFTADPTPLRIESAEDFGFTALHSIEAFVQEASAPASLVVLDNNVLGTGAGWELNATLNGFTSEEDASLVGATIDLAAAALRSDNNFSQPIPVAAELSNTSSLIASVDRSVGGSETAGYGRWTLDWAVEDIVLNVPEGASTPGNHTAEIVWTLTNSEQ